MILGINSAYPSTSFQAKVNLLQRTEDLVKNDKKFADLVAKVKNEPSNNEVRFRFDADEHKQDFMVSIIERNPEGKVVQDDIIGFIPRHSSSGFDSANIPLIVNGKVIS